MTIQEAAYFLLRKYYRDFSLNNPAAMLLSSNSKRRKLNDSTTENNTNANMNISSKDFKVYNLDKGSGMDSANDMAVEQSKQVIQAQQQKKKENHGWQQRFYDNIERERNCKKRKVRLEYAAEDVFSRLNRHEGSISRRQLKAEKREFGHSSELMDANEAATVLFPHVARTLQKYLRGTRQHLHYTLASTSSHLAESFRRGLSYNAFLKRYISPRPQLSYPDPPSNFSDDSYGPTKAVEWSISSENSLTSLIDEATYFKLTAQDFSLCVQIYEQPKITLTEAFPDNRCKFTLKINTTSV